MTTAYDPHRKSEAEKLRVRYYELLKVKQRLDAEVVAVENGLRMAGLMPAGRPALAPTHTLAESRKAHSAYARGHRDDWTVSGERQYQRDRKRASRQREAS